MKIPQEFVDELKTILFSLKDINIKGDRVFKFKNYRQILALVEKYNKGEKCLT